MAHVFPFFVTPCLESFHFLETRYGFDAPVVEQLGRECFIRYRKGGHWVSIAYEPGSSPIVELFHPPLEIKHRRISRLKSGPAEPGRIAAPEEIQLRFWRQTLRTWS
jgi:hypothetical protein